MQDFRVIDLPERTTLDSSDYTMIDSAENGTNKYLLSRQAAETDAKIATAVGGVEAELDAAVEGIEEDITALQGDVETVETTLGTKADTDGTYPDMAVGSVLGTNTVTDREPYFLRPSASIGDREFDTLVGGSLGWNQLCNGSSVTVENGHKYYMIKGGAKSVGASDGTAITGLTSGTDIVSDLTIDFGATIADYIYSLEQATAGAGVAWVRRYLPNDYYAYCAPTLKHVTGVNAHVMTGFNLFDKSTAVDNKRLSSDGTDISDTLMAHSDYIRVSPNTTYYSNASATGMYTTVYIYDSEKRYISAQNPSPGTFTTPANAYYVRVQTAKAQRAIDDVCVNISSSKNGQYEPYVSHTYPLDSTWTGMGVPKLDSNNKLYFDGDTYASDGTVTERFGIVDLGTLNWTYMASGSTVAPFFYATKTDIKYEGPPSATRYTLLCPIYTIGIRKASNFLDKQIVVDGTSAVVNQIQIKDSAYTDAASFKTAMSGVYLVYEKATPTTSSASPFTSPQICDPNGTEEYVTTGLVPVGHETEYVENLADKLTDIPDLPTTAGTYSLKVTVSGGVPSYSWVSA